MYTGLINEASIPSPLLTANSAQVHGSSPVQSPANFNLSTPLNTIGSRNITPLSPLPMTTTTHVPSHSTVGSPAFTTQFLATGLHAIRYPPGFPQDRMFIIEKYFNSLIECDLLDLGIAHPWSLKQPSYTSDIRTPSDNIICSMPNEFINTDDQTRPLMPANTFASSNDNVNNPLNFGRVNYANSATMMMMNPMVLPARTSIEAHRQQYFQQLGRAVQEASFLQNTTTYNRVTSDDNGFCSGGSLTGVDKYIQHGPNTYYNVNPSVVKTTNKLDTPASKVSVAPSAMGLTCDTRQYLGGSCRSISKSVDTNKPLSGRSRRRHLPDEYSRDVLINACRKYGVKMKIAPPIPESRNYTVSNGRKIRFPQTRRLNSDWCGSSACMKLSVGDIVRVLGPSLEKRGHFRVESLWPEQGPPTMDLPYNILDSPEKACTT